MPKRKNSSSLNHKSVLLSAKKKPCQFCDKVHIQDQVNTLEADANGKPFRCQFCNQIFSISCLFVKHMEIHLGKSLYRCEFCGFLFVDFFDLITHRQAHLLFACKHCDKSFGDEESSKKHAIRFHGAPKTKKQRNSSSSSDSLRENEKKFSLMIDEILQKNTAVLKPFHSCDICYENFPQLSQLLVHKKTHTKEKPYKCNTCGKSFKHDNILKAHQKVHHQKVQQQQLHAATNDDKHVWKLCDQNFSQQVADNRTRANENPKVVALKENSKTTAVLLATQLGSADVLSERTESSAVRNRKLGPVIENLTPPAHLGAKTVYLLSKPYTQLDPALNSCPSPTSPLLNVRRNSVIQQVRQEKSVLVGDRNLTVKPPNTTSETNDSAFLSNGLYLDKKQQLRLLTMSDPCDNGQVPNDSDGKSNNGLVNPMIMENYLILKLPSPPPPETNQLKNPNYGAIVQSHPCSVVASAVTTAPPQQEETMEISIVDTVSLSCNNAINYSKVKMKSCETNLEPDPDINPNPVPYICLDSEQPLSLVKSEPVEPDENTQDEGFKDSAAAEDTIKEEYASLETSSEFVIHSETPAQNGEDVEATPEPEPEPEIEVEIKQERDCSDYYEQVVESDTTAESSEVPISSVKQEAVLEISPVEEQTPTTMVVVAGAVAPLVVKRETESVTSTPMTPEDGVIGAVDNNQKDVAASGKTTEDGKQKEDEYGKGGQKGKREGCHCVHCGKSHSKALFEFLVQSPKNKPFKCQVCGDTFSVGCLFIKHIDSHEEAKGSILYQCEVCGTIFEQFLSLFSHRQAMHRSSNYSCAQCQWVFVCASDLKRHTRLVHYVEKAYACDYCGRSFTQKCNLVFHRRTHTGEQPYSCEHCSKRFARPGNLNIHLNTHTAAAKAKLHRCTTCFKPFKTRQQLKFHTQVLHHYRDNSGDVEQQRGAREGAGAGDTPFKCDICGDCYSSCKELKEHVQLHQSDDKLSYMCNICGKQFLHSYMLLRHKLSHRGRLCQSAKVLHPRTPLDSNSQP